MHVVLDYTKAGNLRFTCYYIPQSHQSDESGNRGRDTGEDISSYGKIMIVSYSTVE